MTQALTQFGFAAFVIACRIGACIMLLPGFSSMRIGMQFRALAVLAIALALAPLLYDRVASGLPTDEPGSVLKIIAGELAAGSLIGLMARLQLLALHFAAGFMSGAIGLQGVPGQPMDDHEAAPALTTLLSMATIVMLFAAGFHIQVLRAVIESYRVLPTGEIMPPQLMLRDLMRVVSDSSLVGLRVAGPFAAYSIVVNLAIGLAGKFAPQVSLYFASLGLLTMGGLFLLYLLAPAWIAIFADSLESWLRAFGG